MINIKDSSFSHNFSLIPMAASIDKKNLNNLLETNTFRLPVIDHLFTLMKLTTSPFKRLLQEKY